MTFGVCHMIFAVCHITIHKSQRLLPIVTLQTAFVSVAGAIFGDFRAVKGDGKPFSDDYRLVMANFDVSQIQHRESVAISTIAARFRAIG